MKRGYLIFTILVTIFLISIISINAEEIDQNTPPPDPNTLPDPNTPPTPEEIDPTTTEKTDQEQIQESGKEVAKKVTTDVKGLKNSFTNILDKIKKPIFIPISKVSAFLTRITGFNFKENSAKFWHYIIIGILVQAWIFLVFFLKKLSKDHSKNWIDLFLWRGQQYPSSGGTGARILRAWKFYFIFIPFPIIYFLLTLVPILNSLISIITFEFLTENIFIHSFMLAFYIGFGPELIQRLLKYRSRQVKYEEKLKTEAGREVLRALVKK